MKKVSRYENIIRVNKVLLVNNIVKYKNTNLKQYIVFINIQNLNVIILVKKVKLK